MRSRVTLLCMLVLCPALGGCAKPSMGDPSEPPVHGATASRDTTPAPARTQPPDAKKPAAAGTNVTKAAYGEKTTTLKDHVAKHGYHLTDPKEADFPLVIEMESPPVPDEIKGPFPEDAPWRTEKSPERKPEKSFWPW
jgi:hypothetical protein